MDKFKCEVLLSKLGNVLNVKEFQPIVKMCEEWLSDRDETRFEKTNKELLRNFMSTEWLSVGTTEWFICLFVTKWDLLENSQKAQCWKECGADYLRNKYVI